MPRAWRSLWGVTTRSEAQGVEKGSLSGLLGQAWAMVKLLLKAVGHLVLSVSLRASTQ